MQRSTSMMPPRRLNKHPFANGEIGRRTGWKPKADVKKDADGTDNVQDFFQSDEEEQEEFSYRVVKEDKIRRRRGSDDGYYGRRTYDDEYDQKPIRNAYQSNDRYSARKEAKISQRDYDDVRIVQNDNISPHFRKSIRDYSDLPPRRDSIRKSVSAYEDSIERRASIRKSKWESPDRRSLIRTSVREYDDLDLNNYESGRLSVSPEQKPSSARKFARNYVEESPERRYEKSMKVYDEYPDHRTLSARKVLRSPERRPFSARKSFRDESPERRPASIRKISRADSPDLRRMSSRKSIRDYESPVHRPESNRKIIREERNGEFYERNSPSSRKSIREPLYDFEDDYGQPDSPIRKRDYESPVGRIEPQTDHPPPSRKSVNRYRDSEDERENEEPSNSRKSGKRTIQSTESEMESPSQTVVRIKRAKKAPVKRVAKCVQRPEVESREYPGARKSSRAKVQPIQWWDNEVIKYKNVKEEGCLLPFKVIDEVIRVDIDDSSSLPAYRKKKKPVTKKEPLNVIDKTKRAVMVEAKNSNGDLEKQQLVISQSMISFESTQTHFEYAKTQQIDHLSSASTGFMVIQAGGEKPNRNTKGNTLSFVVVTGKVEVTIHKTSVNVGVGTQFNVPAGNQYKLVNRGLEECRVFWVCLTPSSEMHQETAELQQEVAELQQEVADLQQETAELQQETAE